MAARSDEKMNRCHIVIRSMEKEDGEEMLRIYEQGIETKNATFEVEAPTWHVWDENHVKHSRFVASKHGKVVGWSALLPYSSRTVYHGVAELSVYINPDYAGQGVGSKLMKKIVESAQVNGCWMLQSSIFPENIASIALHKKFGFREVGYREKIAQLDGVWRDVLLFEKRL